MNQHPLKYAQGRDTAILQPIIRVAFCHMLSQRCLASGISTHLLYWFCLFPFVLGHSKSASRMPQFLLYIHLANLGALGLGVLSISLLSSLRM